MNTINLFKLFGLSCLSTVLLVTLPVRADEQSDKLKKLEAAMTQPSAQETAPAKNLVRKPHTRAIVFDPTPESASTPPQEPAQPQATPQTTVQPQAVASVPAPAAPSVTKAINCGAIPPEAKITAVDFAIQFKVGSAELTTPAEATLRQIAKVLSMSSNCVLVEGHTDSAGNVDRNLELSRQRAASVVKFISDQAGIPTDRLVPVGKGSSEPVTNLNSRDPKNRRVVFKVVG